MAKRGRKSLEEKARENLTPEERRERASNAAYARWYNPKRGSIERAETVIRQIGAEIFDAREQNNSHRLMRAFGQLLPWEKWLYFLRHNKNAQIELESDPVVQEMETKLLEARNRREKALGATDEGSSPAEVDSDTDSGEDSGEREVLP